MSAIIPMPIFLPFHSSSSGEAPVWAIVLGAVIIFYIIYFMLYCIVLIENKKLTLFGKIFFIGITIPIRIFNFLFFAREK